MIALSIVAPNGTRIADGTKRIEVRSWCPTQMLPIINLLIVENSRYLTAADSVDPYGRPVAVVDIVSVRPWREDEVEAACSAGWEPGYFAWIIGNVRKVRAELTVPAQLGLYDIELNDDELGIRTGCI